MDGLKKRLSESLQLTLSLVLSLAILVVAIVAGGLSFLSAVDEARELQDDILRQIAGLIDRQQLSPALAAAGAGAKGRDEESRVIVQRLGESDPAGRGVDDGGSLALPVTLTDGLQTVGVDGESFRVLVKTTAAGERFVVAQEDDFRDEIARDSALHTIMPFLILVPILLLIVANLVRKMFRPIVALASEIDQRSEHELDPVNDHRLPVEVRPFAVAINRLLARVDRTLNAQRRFVADAAHELRSPFAALSLQAERLAQADMSDPARERLAALRQGIERGRNLLDQLLALARAQSAAERPKSAVSVQMVFRRVLEDLVPLAESRKIDIGVEGIRDARVEANELDLITVVRNLVDNAIRYTPEGGRVDLSVSTDAEHAVLRVQDTGPGIALAERNRVFDPFYRAPGSGQVGSGLGLSIVHMIAQRIGAEIRLDFSDEAKHTGLKIDVIVPINRRSSASDSMLS